MRSSVWHCSVEGVSTPEEIETQLMVAQPTHDMFLDGRIGWASDDCGKRSYYSALLSVSEIDDVNRFPDSSHLCSYDDLTPSTHSSRAISYHVPITKAGSRHLRWGA